MTILRMAILLQLAAPFAASADEPVTESSKTVEQQQIAEALQLTTTAAQEFSLAASNDPDHPLTLEPKSLLQWSNPAAGTLYGNVFIWTSDQRPQAIASIYKWYSPHTHAAYEFNSLSTRSLTARRDGDVVWNPQQAGLSWELLPGTRPPSASKTARLLQLRTIAREFFLEKTDREGLTQSLRLLPQPIYRYSSPSQHVIDGALFAFVQGTDPEVFLLLEATGKEEGAAPVWNFALVRMNSVKFVATRQDQEVWRVEIAPWAQVTRRDSVYRASRLK